MRSSRVRVAVVAAAASAVLGVPGIGHADPAVPQAGAPCPVEAVDALTILPDNSMLQCGDQPGTGYRWQVVLPNFPSSTRWVSYGPALQLHGQGLRNFNMESGPWTATPLDADTQCAAEQNAVVDAGVVGPSHTTTGAPGRPLSLEVVRNMFSIALTGDCLWAKT